MNVLYKSIRCARYLAVTIRNRSDKLGLTCACSQTHSTNKNLILLDAVIILVS